MGFFKFIFLVILLGVGYVFFFDRPRFDTLKENTFDFFQETFNELDFG